MPKPGLLDPIKAAVQQQRPERRRESRGRRQVAIGRDPSEADEGHPAGHHLPGRYRRQFGIAAEGRDHRQRDRGRVFRRAGSRQIRCDAHRRQLAQRPDRRAEVASGHLGEGGRGFSLRQQSDGVAGRHAQRPADHRSQQQADRRARANGRGARKVSIRSRTSRNPAAIPAASTRPFPRK